MKVAFTLTGEMPLLMHQDSVEQADGLMEWRTAPENKEISKAGDDRSPPWSWMSYLYSDGEHVAIPGDNLKTCLRYGATKITIKAPKTYKELSQSGILMEKEFLEFRCGESNEQIPWSAIAKMQHLPFAEQAEAVKKLGFCLFVKRAKVNTSKHVRVRPRFNRWSVSGTLEIVSDLLDFNLVERFFALSGRGGLCDWRPSSPKSPGVYGMFTSELREIK